jgi:maltose O-acetyltransferase
MRRVIAAVLLRASTTYMIIRMTWWRSRLEYLGRNARLARTVKIYVPGKVRIGSGSVVNDFVHIWGGGHVDVGDDCLIAAHVVITSQTHATDALAAGALYRETHLARPVRIMSNVWIGSNACILPGVTIGPGAIIGAGAVVTRDVPPKSLALGVPARIVKTLA